MRELAILARKQIAAELRGRDNTPAGDYDEEGDCLSKYNEGVRSF